MNDPSLLLTSPSFSSGTKGMTRREAISKTLKAGAGLSMLCQIRGILGETEAEQLPGTSAVLEGGVVTVTLNINGTAHTLSVEPRVTLLDALREHLGMSGTKKGCDHGQCDTYTVLVNGERINSCLTLAVRESRCAFDRDPFCR